MDANRNKTHKSHRKGLRTKEALTDIYRHSWFQHEEQHFSKKYDYASRNRTVELSPTLLAAHD